MIPSLNAAVKTRVRISPRLKYAELTIVSMYEELQVIRATEVTEEELKNLANELCNAVVDVDLQVSLAKRCQTMSPIKMLPLLYFASLLLAIFM